MPATTPYWTPQRQQAISNPAVQQAIRNDPHNIDSPNYGTYPGGINEGRVVKQSPLMKDREVQTSHGKIYVAEGGRQYDAETNVTYFGGKTGVYAYYGNLDKQPAEGSRGAFTPYGGGFSQQVYSGFAQQQAAEKRVELAAKQAANRAAAVQGIDLKPAGLPAGLAVVRGWVVPKEQALKELRGDYAKPISERGRKIPAGASSEGVYFGGKFTPMFYEGKYVGGSPVEEKAVAVTPISPYLQKVREKMGESAFNKLFYSSKSYENAAKNYGKEKASFERDVKRFNASKSDSVAEYESLKARESALNAKYAGLEELRLGTLKEGYGDVERYYKVNPPTEKVEQKQPSFQLTGKDWLSVSKEYRDANKFVDKYGVKSFEEKREVEGLQAESEANLFSMPGGEAIQVWEKGLTGVNEFFDKNAVAPHYLGKPFADFELAVGRTVIGTATSVLKPSVVQTQLRMGAVTIRQATAEPERFIKQVGTGFSIAAKKAPEVLTTPAGLGAVVGTGATFFLLSGGKFFPKKPVDVEAAAEAVLRRGDPLSVSFGKLVGVETKRGMAGSVRNKFVIDEGGNVVRAADVERIRFTDLTTQSESKATAKGLRIELTVKGGKTTFTRIQGNPETLFTSVAEVFGEGEVQLPSTTRFGFNMKNVKESWIEGFGKQKVPGKWIPFKAKYQSTSGGGIVSGARIEDASPVFKVGKGEITLDAGKLGARETFLNAQTTTTPILEVPAKKDFITPYPKNAIFSFIKGEPFLKYVKAKTKLFGDTAYIDKNLNIVRRGAHKESGFFNIRELGSRDIGKNKVIETFSWHGRSYAETPIKSFQLAKKVAGRYDPFSVMVEGEKLPFKVKNFGDTLKQLRRIRAESAKRSLKGKVVGIQDLGELDARLNELSGFRERAGGITAKGKLTTPLIDNFFNRVRGRNFYQGDYGSVRSASSGKEVVHWHTHPTWGMPSEADLINSLRSQKPSIIVSEEGFTVYKPKAGITLKGLTEKYGKNYVLDTGAKIEEFRSFFDVKQYAKESPVLEKSNLPPGYSGKLDVYPQASKSFGFGKVMRSLESHDIDYPSGGVGSVGGGGSTQKVTLKVPSRGGMQVALVGMKGMQGKVPASKVELIGAGLTTTSGFEIRNAAASAVKEYYGKANTAGMFSNVRTTAGIGGLTITRPTINRSETNRGVMNITRGGTTSLTVPRSVEQTRNVLNLRSMGEVSTRMRDLVSTRTATRMINAGATQMRSATNLRSMLETRGVTATTLRVGVLERAATTQRTAMRTMTRTLTVTRAPMLTITPTTPTPPPDTPDILIVPPKTDSGDFKRKKGKKTRGYRTLVKRRGKWFSIGGVAPRGIALKLGERYTTKTLGARFKAEPTSMLLESDGDSAYKAPLSFRDYTIKRGRKVPLIDEFIQRNRFRLSSKQERSEIKSAKRSKALGLSQAFNLRL